MRHEHAEQESFLDVSSFIKWVCESFGAQRAVQLLLIWTMCSSLSLTAEPVAAQSEDASTVPSISAAEFDVTEATAAAVTEAPVNVYITDLAELQAQIREGLSSKTYRLTFNNQETFSAVSEYLSESNIFFSTGKVFGVLTPQLLHQIYGDSFTFVIENDTQAVREIHESATFHRTLAPEQLPPAQVISDTQVTRTGELVKISTITTDTVGLITETVTYSAPWTYAAGETILKHSLASGRGLVAVQPSFILVEPITQLESLHNEFALNTGGEIAADGTFTPSFLHDPIFESGTHNYHGEVIAQIFQAQAAHTQNVVLIMGDSTTYAATATGLPLQFIELLDSTNKRYGTAYKVIITESMSAAPEHHNKLLMTLQQRGIQYQNFVRIFAAAGNENKITTHTSIDSNAAVQVVALDQELRGLTPYSNYGRDNAAVIGARGTALALKPQIDEYGNLIFVSARFHGTSIAAPQAAGEAVAHASAFATTPLSELFEPKDIIYSGEIQSGEQTDSVGVLSDALLNEILRNTNPGLPEDFFVEFDANWSALNGVFAKAEYLSAIQMPWSAYLQQPTQFSVQPTFSFTDFYQYIHVAQVYAVQPNGSRQLIENWNFPEAVQRIQQLELNHVTPDVVGPHFTVAQIRQSIGVSMQVPPSPTAVDLENFKVNATLLRDNFDPSFGAYLLLELSRNEDIFLPLVMVGE